MRALFYEESIDIYEYVAREAPGRSKITFLNSGDGDLFVNEVVFSYISPGGHRLERTIIVNQWIRRSEVKSLYPAIRTAASNSTAGPRRFDAMAADLGSQQDIMRCFSLLVGDYAWKQRPLGTNVRPGLADVPVKVVIRASSARSKGLVDYTASGNYAGFIMMADACADNG